MRRSLAIHDELVRSAADSFNGHLFKALGDAFFVAFDNASDAVCCASEIQRKLHVADWQDAELKVRIAMTLGDAEFRDEDYFGRPLNRCARMLTVCNGGQTIVSESVFQSFDSDTQLRRFVFAGSPPLKDLEKPEPIYHLLIPEIPQELGELAGPRRVPNNLPIQISSFVGRSAELERATKAVLENSLVTMTGVGGCGKTRLSLQTASEIADTFSDGVAFVPLEAVTDDRGVVYSISAALNEIEIPGAEAEKNSQRIGQKRMLLVLDNCEHVVLEVGAIVSKLLAACPNLKVLATSRERLHIPGETAFKVPPLELNPHADTSLSEASELFLERARAISPELMGAGTDFEQVRQIVSQLEGLPLLIELASARVAVLTLEEINSRLKQRIRLLTDKSGATPLRQQTFQGTMDWSYDALTPEQQTLLRRFSVFAISFDAATAEAIAEGIEIVDIIDELGQLADKSLIVPIEGEAGTRRFRILNPVREYLRDKLELAGEDVAARTLHYKYFKQFAEEGYAQLVGPDQQVWLKRFSDDHQNLLAALTWAIDPAERIQLVVLVARYWYFSSRYREGRSWLENALLSYRQEDNWRARAESVLGTMALVMGDLPKASAHSERAYEILSKLGDDSGVASSANNLALIAQRTRDFERAEKLLLECRQAFQRLNDKRNEGLVLTNLTGIAHEMGELNRSLEYAETAATLLESVGDRGTLAMAYHNWWAANRDQKGDDDKPELLAKSLELAIELDNYSAVSICLLGVSEVLAKEHKWEECVHNLVGVERIAREFEIEIQENSEKTLNRIYDEARRNLGDDGLETVKGNAVSKELRAIILTALQAAKSR